MITRRETDATVACERIDFVKTRVISATIGVALLIAVLALGTPYIQIAVTFIGVLAVYELFNAVKLADKKSLLITALIGAAGLLVCLSFSLAMFLPALYVWLVVLFVYYIANRETTLLKDVAVTFLLTVYPCFLFGHLLHIRSMTYGEVLVWAVFVCAFLTDTCAMFGGKFFGKHRLCPKLSPKKTVEGAVCGVLGCVISMIVYCLICGWITGVSTSVLNAVIIAFGASVISQLGDLSASCIKREFGIKDYGNIMPGHGGVMDRFDSLLFVAPFVCYMLIIFPIFK